MGVGDGEVWGLPEYIFIVYENFARIQHRFSLEYGLFIRIFQHWRRLQPPQTPVSYPYGLFIALLGFQKMIAKAF